MVQSLVHRLNPSTLLKVLPSPEQSVFNTVWLLGCWNGTYDATKVKPACYAQNGSPTQGMSEDCLNMNIYSPVRNDTQLLPVLFFVYGGGNLVGKNTDYNMKEFARLMGDVVVVVPNYRLGTLGYLVHEPSAITGNYGIGDILTTFEFIRPLLASFGGDKGRITLMGQSSGATNIFALLGSSRSKGLFQAAICFSGSHNVTMSMNATSKLHEKYILPAVGCDVHPSKVLSCLQGRSAQNLTHGVNGIVGPPPSINPPNLPFSPHGNELIGLSIVDGVILKQPLLEAVKEAVVDVPLIIQSCLAEMDPTIPNVDNLQSVEEYAKWLVTYMTQNGWRQDVALKIVELYRQDLSVSVELGFESFLADLGVTCGNDAVAFTASKAFKSPVYRTQLVASPSHILEGRRYAFHSWDMPVAGANDWWGFFEPQPSDFALGEGLRRMWREFIYTGRLSDKNWNEGGCTAVSKDGRPQECAKRQCKALEDLGFGKNFWWTN